MDFHKKRERLGKEVPNTRHVVLRGAVVKSDSGSYAVNSEQGSFASSMTAAKVLDFISRLLDCAGEASDAVSAFTQVKMEDAPESLRVWIRPPRLRCPRAWDQIQDPLVPLEIFTDIHWQDHRERDTSKNLTQRKLGEYLDGNAHACIAKSFSLLVCGRPQKIQDRRNTLKPVWDQLRNM